jgi:hypothetical protein
MLALRHMKYFWYLQSSEYGNVYFIHLNEALRARYF